MGLACDFPNCNVIDRGKGETVSRYWIAFDVVDLETGQAEDHRPLSIEIDLCRGHAAHLMHRTEHLLGLDAGSENNDA